MDTGNVVSVFSLVLAEPGTLIFCLFERKVPCVRSTSLVCLKFGVFSFRKLWRTTDSIFSSSSVSGSLLKSHSYEREREALSARESN